MTETPMTNRDRLKAVALDAANLDFTVPELKTEELLKIDTPEIKAPETKPEIAVEPEEPKEQPEIKAEEPEIKKDKEKEEPADPAPVIKKTKKDYIAERLAKKAEKAKEPDSIERLAELLSKKDDKPVVQPEKPVEQDYASDLLLNPKETIERLKSEIRAEALKEIEGKLLPEVQQLKQQQQIKELNEGYRELNNIYDKVATVDVEFTDAYDVIREKLIDTLADKNPQATAEQIEYQLKMDELALIQQASPQIALLQEVNGISEEQAVAVYFKHLAARTGWQPKGKSAAEVVKEKTLNEKRVLKEKTMSMNGAGAGVPAARDWAAGQVGRTNREKAHIALQAKKR